MSQSSTLNTGTPGEKEFYEISAVSRLTGLSTHNLRVWEKRHEVVEPVRSDNGRRLYTRKDVRKLGLLKTLVDRGHSIGSLASLTAAQLEERLKEHDTETLNSHSTSEQGVRSRRCRVAIAGNFVKEAFREAGPLSNEFRTVSEHNRLEDLENLLRPGSVDVVVLEEDTLFDDRIEEIQSMMTTVQARRVVVTYRFAPRKAIERIEASLPGITPVRAPANATELRLACLAGMTLERNEINDPEAADRSLSPLPITSSSDAEVPHRKFSDSELATISRTVPAVQCECPQHVATLVSSLLAFESYSRQCENRNEDDARLHAFLSDATARARVTMEEALQRILIAEDFELPG